MAQIFTNNAIARIISPISISDMTIVIDPVRASLFPNPTKIEDYFLITLDDITDPDIYEIVKIGSRTGNQLNVTTRGYENSGAKAWAIDDTIIDHRLTAGTLDSFLPVTRINGFNVVGGGTQYLDSMSLTPSNIMVKWQITIIETINNKVQSLEVHAIYKPATVSITWNKFSVIGDAMNVIITPEIVGSLIKLKIENNETNTIIINTTRIRHL